MTWSPMSMLSRSSEKFCALNPLTPHKTMMHKSILFMIVRTSFNSQWSSHPEQFHQRFYEIFARVELCLVDAVFFQCLVGTFAVLFVGVGYVQDYRHEEICVVESCLSDDAAKNSFDYLKRVAKINKLGENEEHAGILSEFYEKIDFIDSSLAVAPYLNPSKNKIRRTKSPFLIFPFGCNASQEKAVTAAFENQLSVIQGPPGTGKMELENMARQGGEANSVPMQ